VVALDNPIHEPVYDTPCLTGVPCVNKAAGVSALALRINNQDWVYKFDITGDTAKLMRRYRVGLGDNPAGSGIGALTSPRMDFQTVAIFADGRVACSFLDSTTFSHPPARERSSGSRRPLQSSSTRRCHR
jgi:hypothetical protein